MTSEFKVKKGKNITVYTLESITSAGSISAVPGVVGKTQQRSSLIAQEGDTIKVPVKQKPRQGPLRPQTGGGAHRDKKKEQKQGKEKHRKPFAESAGFEDPDHEASMARNELYRNAKYGIAMLKMIEPGQQLEGWVESSLTKAASYLDKIYHYLDYETKFGKGIDNSQEEPEDDIDEDSQEGDMARENLMLIVEYSTKLFKMIKDGDDLEGWVFMKLTKASECVSSAKHHLEYEQFKNHGLDLDEGKIKGVDGKACWKGKRYAGKVKKADGTYKDKCVPVSEAGFVDVTGWSDRAVQRLGHQDDYDEKPRPYEISRTYFKIPYDQSKEAKALYGLRWDPDKKLWYKPKYNTSGATHSFHIQQLEKKFPIVKMEQGTAEEVNIGKEWMSDTELDQYIPDGLQDEWRELLGYDMDGNTHPLWRNMTDIDEPNSNDPKHRKEMVRVANKWLQMKRIPNVTFYDVKDIDDELEWLVQVGGEENVDEISDTTKTSYKEKAQAQVKELEPWTKKGEYKNLAKRAIQRREKGLARVSEDGYLSTLTQMLEGTLDEKAPPGWSEEDMMDLKKKYGKDRAFAVAWGAYKKAHPNWKPKSAKKK